MRIPSSDLNTLMIEIWKVVIKNLEPQFTQPWNWTCQGILLTTNIEWKLSKRIQRLQKILKQNLQNVEAFMEVNDQGFLVFKMDQVEKIDCLHKILWTSLTDWMKDWPRKAWAHLKVEKWHE